MQITRRPATTADFDFARVTHHRAYRTVVEAQFGAWNEADQDWFFQADWRAPEQEIILYNAVPCGYLKLQVKPDTLYLAEIVIDPDYQGRGIGTGLLAQCQAAAQQRNLPLTLRTMHKNRAQALYQRLGFVETSRDATHTYFVWNPPTPA